MEERRKAFEKVIIKPINFLPKISQKNTTVYYLLTLSNYNLPDYKNVFMRSHLL